MMIIIIIIIILIIMMMMMMIIMLYLHLRFNFLSERLLSKDRLIWVVPSPPISFPDKNYFDFFFFFEMERSYFANLIPLKRNFFLKLLLKKLLLQIQFESHQSENLKLTFQVIYFLQVLLIEPLLLHFQ